MKPTDSAISRRPKRVTIADVSEALGLTKSTISRALNDYPDISPSTRAKVRSTAARMGYRPSSQAQAIKTGRTRSVGLVVQIDEHDAHGLFLADFLAGISFAASQENWTLTVSTADNEAAALATMQRLTDERKADGFILPRTKRRDPRVELCRAQEVPFVMFGRTGVPDGASWYDIQGENAMSGAVQHLADLGHRRIGFINGSFDYNFSHLRLSGFRFGVEQNSLDNDPALECAGATTAEDGRDAARALLRLPNPPTAIVCALDRAALGVFEAAAELGLEVGRDVSVIAYDGIPEGGFTAPGLSTYCVDYRRAGERLAHLLIEQVRGAEPASLRAFDQATFLDRGSAGAPLVEAEELGARVRAHLKARTGQPLGGN